MFEMFNAFNCRSDRHSLLKVGFTKNRFLLIAVASSILLQLAVMYIPFLQAIFETAPLGVYDWALVILLSATVILAVEASKRAGREVERNTDFQSVRLGTREAFNSS
jgi:Ca2+-transporting ATPase